MISSHKVCLLSFLRSRRLSLTFQQIVLLDGRPASFADVFLTRLAGTLSFHASRLARETERFQACFRSSELAVRLTFDQACFLASKRSFFPTCFHAVLLASTGIKSPGKALA